MEETSGNLLKHLMYHKKDFDRLNHKILEEAHAATKALEKTKNLTINMQSLLKLNKPDVLRKAQ